MFGFNLTPVATYRQLDRAFLVDTQLAKQLGVDTRSIELVQLVFPYFIYPLGLVANIILVLSWQLRQELKKNRSRMGKLYIQLFSTNNMIVLTCYLLNFIQHDNTSLVSYSRFTCKAFSFLIRVLTAFHSWLYLLMMYLILNLFNISARPGGVIESRAPILIRTSETTRLNPYFKRLCVIFFSLCLAYSFDLVFVDQIEYKHNEFKTFKRCGIPDDYKYQRLIILAGHTIDLVAFCIAPLALISIKTSVAMKKVVEKRNRADQLAKSSHLISPDEEHSKATTSHSRCTAAQEKSARFYSRSRRMFFARTVIFIGSIFPLFVCLIFYIFYALWPSEPRTLESLIKIDLAFTILCLNNLLATGLMMFFLSLYVNKIFRRIIVDLFYTKPSSFLKYCCYCGCCRIVK